MGDQHYIVNGIELREGDAPSLDSEMYNGNAEIVGSNVLMMLHTSRDDEDEIGGGKFNIVISISSLSGTLNGTTNYYDKNTEERGAEYFEGVVEVVACPS